MAESWKPHGCLFAATIFFCFAFLGLVILAWFDVLNPIDAMFGPTK